jgi:hypothetical protein
MKQPPVNRPLDLQRPFLEKKCRTTDASPLARLDPAEAYIGDLLRHTEVRRARVAAVPESGWVPIEVNGPFPRNAAALRERQRRDLFAQRNRRRCARHLVLPELR